ncbi:alkane monooxygenase [Pseudonocardia sulfidoxydans NBRC 16205]|uniref:Alkane monooxygenase n=1 Tax=Pseudonocardia sulfidoxydans NBRC 16205 TaxID=1223511 RepID=A0A511DBR5_9PSEU|nr:MsnO8 family LLM class oxidoreductase [Pseudonocardia sulfidoxydans]GEL22246.1 alkane monooxygenase [Pseudonocardia sulfidoxydans NBRC 16205]
MRYSLVELAPVTPGAGKTAALEQALGAAEDAERLGYHRFWFAEHHHTTGYAAQDPAPLIAIASRRTSRIRLGSGAVLLNHYSPYSVAERYLMLQALAPGRIDLGLGRSSAGPLVDHALRRDRQGAPVEDFFSQVEEVVGYLHHAFGPGHPYESVDLTHGIDGVPEVWVLGSSGGSAALAGGLGLGYAFGSHINPAMTGPAIERYRQSFTTTRFGPQEPTVVLTLNIVAADDEELAHRLTWPARALRTLGRERPVPTLAQATAELDATTKAEPSVVRDGVVPPQISGTPESLRAQLEPLVRDTGATEIMVQDMLTDPALRRRSRELVAQALAPIGAGAVGTHQPPIHPSKIP